MQLTTIPMPGMTPAGIRPAAWSPAPYRPGASPFMAQARPRMGQILGSSSIFNHPAVALAIDAGVISIAYLATKTKAKEFDNKTWRAIAWGTLIASSLKALNDLVRLFTMPGPAPAVPQPGEALPPAPPVTSATAQPGA